MASAIAILYWINLIDINLESICHGYLCFSDVSGEWICLQFRRSILRSKFGIAVKDEAAMPVGKKDCL